MIYISLKLETEISPGTLIETTVDSSYVPFSSIPIKWVGNAWEPILTSSFTFPPESSTIGETWTNPINSEVGSWDGNQWVHDDTSRTKTNIIPNLTMNYTYNSIQSGHYIITNNDSHKISIGINSIITIKPDGQVILGPGYQPGNITSDLFWETVTNNSPKKLREELKLAQEEIVRLQYDNEQLRDHLIRLEVAMLHVGINTEDDSFERAMKII